MGTKLVDGSLVTVSEAKHLLLKFRYMETLATFAALDPTMTNNHIINNRLYDKRNKSFSYP
jgi:hypothetical protein